MTEVWGQILLTALWFFTMRHDESLPAGPFQVGTAIVAVRTESVLVVAADSKTTRLDAPDASTNTCKIQEVADVFFAVAGLRRSTDGDFDVPLLAARACRTPGTLGEKVVAFEDAMQGPLTAALVRIRDAAPDYYRSRAQRHAAFVEVAFFTNEGAKPRFLVREFRAKESEQKVLWCRRALKPRVCLVGRSPRDAGLLGRESDRRPDEPHRGRPGVAGPGRYLPPGDGRAADRRCSAGWSSREMGRSKDGVRPNTLERTGFDARGNLFAGHPPESWTGDE
jgi:hypothetical protein